MPENEPDDGANQGTAKGPTRRWQRPLGSTEAALLTELVVERLRRLTGSTHGIGGGRAVEVDVELGVVRAQDQTWSATLAPLAAQLAHTPPEDWSAMVDREVERWQAAVAGVAKQPLIDERSGLSPESGSITLRLTAANRAPGRALRPAFGQLAWELVRDLGNSGRAVLGSSHPGVATRQFWDRVAADTVHRHKARWAHLRLDGVMGVILSGPHVTALLYDPDRLRDRIEQPAGGPALRAAVMTNSLMLITGEHDAIGPTAAVVAESLRRFPSGVRRRFDPTTVSIPAGDVS